MNFNTGEVIGIKRKIDNLGRLVIPVEYREAFNLKEKSEVEIFMVKNGVFIKVSGGQYIMDIKDAVEELELQGLSNKEIIQEALATLNNSMKYKQDGFKRIEKVSLLAINILIAELEKKEKIINFMTKRIKEDSEWFYSDLDNKSENEIKEYFKKKVEEDFNEGDKI